MNKTFCAAAFNQIYTSNDSYYKLCADAYRNETIKKYDVQNTLPFDYFLSPEMEEIRNKMFAGEKIHGCERCYEREERGLESLRTSKYNKEFKNGDINKVRLKVKINGTNCNLGCYMCFPVNSSTRRKELRETNTEEYFSKSVAEDIPVTKGGEYIPLSKGRYEEIIQNVLDNIDMVDSITINGGEPMISPRFWKFLDSIPYEYAKEMKVCVISNMTHIGRSYEMVEKFKVFEIRVSSDHYADKLAWIRYPINVQEFEQNLVTAKDIITDINCTVSILNIDELFEIKEYYETNFDIPVYFDNCVYEPLLLSIRNFPQEQKDLYIEKYKDYDVIVNELSKSIINGAYEKGIEYCKNLEKKRDIKLIDIFNI